jgi:hypothetical protein
MYSVLDMIRLRVMADAIEQFSARRHLARSIANMVMPRAAEVANSTEETDPAATQYLLSWSEPEKDNFRTVRVTGLNLPRELQRHSHHLIVTPLDAIINLVLISCIRLRASEDEDFDRAGSKPVKGT